jgi:4-methyl-5(b-hydroxyethyl)-thiazole monophosphate biosynthesis
MGKRVLLFLAAGFEEVEAITPVDYLRRADIEVVTVAAGADLLVRGSHGILVAADMLIGEVRSVQGFDALILPGGTAGAANLADSGELGVLLEEARGLGVLVCAICAAPVVVLAGRGFLQNHVFTCYPGTEELVDYTGAASGAKWSPARVVVDGALITSRAAGTAGAFSLAIIERLAGKEAASRIAAQVLL